MEAEGIDEVHRTLSGEVEQNLHPKTKIDSVGGARQGDQYH